MAGTNSSAAEVTHISKHGFWLLLEDEELLVAFDKFPSFRKGTIEQISEVQWPAPDPLYWPGLDVDLSVQSTECGGLPAGVRCIGLPLMAV